jgi:hypothetical protein
MPCTKVGDRWLLAKRRPFELSKLRQSLYYAVRRSLDLRREDMAAVSGLGSAAWRYRENAKEQYRLGELCALKNLSGLSWEEFGKLIERCC